MSEAHKQLANHSRLVDSALLVSIVSAACYILGDSIIQGDWRAMGLPRDFFPESSIQATMLLGCMFLMLVGLVVLMVILVGWLFAIPVRWLFARFLSQSARNKVTAHVKDRISQHPRLYPIIAVMMLFAGRMILPYFFSSMHTSYSDAKLPRVISTDPPVDDGLLYLATRNGFVVLKRSGQKSFLILNQDEIKQINLEAPD